MPTFRVYFGNPDGQHGETVVEAASFPAALTTARASFPSVIFTRVWMVDDSACVKLNCPKCRAATERQVAWGAQTEAIIACEKCGTSLRLRRERTVVPRPTSNGQAPSRQQILGRPPLTTAEHTREPTKKDRLRAMVEKPDLVTWHCRACKWAINCDWHERNDVQDCPVCGSKQYVPGAAFAWNSRLIREREAKQRAADYAREQAVHAARQAREAAQREQERKNQLVLNKLADIAAGAGLIESRDAFRYLDAEAIEGIKALSDYADALQVDLMSAMDDNVIAEKSVAYGRPAAAGASIVSLLAGYGWAGLAFGAVAVGARWISNDWKRAQMAEYQAKWTKLLSQFSADEMRAFTAVFAYKYPGIAMMAASMQGHLPS